MIDREKRDALADAIHLLAAGFITNDEFEDLLDARNIPMLQEPSRYADAVIGPVTDRAWCLYDDMRTYRLQGPDRLSPQVRRDVLHWVLFLRSDLEYEWPPCRFINPILAADNIWGCLATILTFGVVARRRHRRQFDSVLRAGDLDTWPFLRKEDVEAAYRNWCPLAAFGAIP